MRSLKSMAAVLAVSMIAASGTAALSPMETLAAGRPESIDRETWARLQDNLLEYDEIENLVVYYNPMYQQVVNMIQPNVEALAEAARQMREDARQASLDAEAAKESGDILNQMILEMTAEGEREAAKQFERSIDSVNRSSELGLNQTRKQLTSGIQQMMIGYNQVLLSEELSATAIELSQTLLQSTETQKNLGMATDADVQSAQKALLSAQSQQQTLNDTKTSLKQNLCLMTGWTYDAAMEIGSVPAPDLSRIASMNPQADYSRALANNYTIISARHSPFGRGTDAVNRKEKTMEEMEGQLKTRLESLYQTVLQNKTAYEAADTAFQSARLTMDGNERKYQMGMMGRLEYLQARVAYLQQKMAADNAALALTQAIANYDWALEGIVELE